MASKSTSTLSMADSAADSAADSVADLAAAKRPSNLLHVGFVRRPHGVKGETYVDLITDRDDRLAVGSRLWTTSRVLVVARSQRLPKRWLVQFEGFADRTAVEALTNAELFAEPIADDADALWVHELVGSIVREVSGVERGKCVGVLANPAHDILELESGALVPVTFVESCRDGVTLINPPEGLFELIQ